MKKAISIHDSWERQSIIIHLDGCPFTVLYRKPGKYEMNLSGPVIHEHSIVEMHLITSGRGCIAGDNSSIQVSKGDLIIIGAGTRHLLTSEMASTLGRFELQLFYDQRPHNRYKEYFDALGMQIIRTDEETVAIADKINREAAQGLPAYREKIQAYILLMMAEIIRLGAIYEEDSAQTLKADPDDPHISDLMLIDNILTNNYNITADDVAQSLHISKRQLYRILSKHNRVTFKQKLMDFRIEKSKSLLLNNTATLLAIAEDVGYSTQSSFCKAFKKHTGFTPGQFKKLNRSELPKMV